MKTKTTSDVETGLMELQGFRLCVAPGCKRQLAAGQGVQTPKGRTCFGPCRSWGEETMS